MTRPESNLCGSVTPPAWGSRTSAAAEAVRISGTTALTAAAPSRVARSRSARLRSTGALFGRGLAPVNCWSLIRPGAVIPTAPGLPAGLARMKAAPQLRRRDRNVALQGLLEPWRTATVPQLGRQD